MIRNVSRALFALLVFSLAVPIPTLAQQRPQSTRPIGSTSSGKVPPGPGGPNRKSTRGTSGGVITVIEQDFDEALAVIQQSYIDGKKLDYKSLFKASIIGMLRSLDPHSNYYDREEFEELKTDQRSQYFGIGASILNYNLGQDFDTYITATFENSPASRAGLRFGDRILAVDGVTMTGKPSIEVRDKIRGPRGSVVRIKLERAADKTTQTIEITRDAVPQPSVPDAYFLNPGVAYVDMTRGFTYTTCDELEGALERLHAKGMTAVVLDLRNNPGGFLDQAIRVAEVFLPSRQLILTQKGRNGYRDNNYESHNGSPDLTPLVVLINGNTASASEIVAGAMQDHDRAVIVGTTSFGKGLVQSIIPLESGALTLTSAKYYTPSGRLIQRDYSHGGFYDYYTHGGSNRLDQKDEPKPQGSVKRTDAGRTVYGGGGIQPDEQVNPRTITPSQRRLLSPVFAFARELVNGRIQGAEVEPYRIQKDIDFHHELQPADFPITDSLFKTFKEFVANEPNFKGLAGFLDHNRSFIELQLRFNLVTVGYGRVMAERVFVTGDDPQVSKALKALPEARNLAMGAQRRRSQP